MKKLFHVFIAGIILISCGNGAKEKTETANSETMQNDRVEVLYFHGAQVCFPYKRLKQVWRNANCPAINSDWRLYARHHQAQFT